MFWYRMEQHEGYISTENLSETVQRKALLKSCGIYLSSSDDKILTIFV